MARYTWDCSPVLERVTAQVTVVREDQLPGGSKTRFVPCLFGQAPEVVFGGPFCGGAPVALAVVGQQLGRRVTLFYAKRRMLHLRQRQALAYGAQLVQVPYGYMSNVQAKARHYAEAAGALFLPLGFDVPAAQAPFVACMEGVRRTVGDPDEVWCATGSGMLARCLAWAFPSSRICAVAVGLRSRWTQQVFPGNVCVQEAPYAFEKACKATVPFPACPHYDRKAWELMCRDGHGTRLFWNVLG